MNKIATIKSYWTTVCFVRNTIPPGEAHGLYYIVYDADLFGTYKQELITYHRTGGSNELVLHFMIPIEQLHRIEI